MGGCKIEGCQTAPRLALPFSASHKMIYLVQHLLLASFGLVLLAWVSRLLRALIRRDAVMQYRSQATLVLLAAWLLPTQWSVCHFTSQPVPVAARSDSMDWVFSDSESPEPETSRRFSSDPTAELGSISTEAFGEVPAASVRAPAAGAAVHAWPGNRASLFAQALESKPLRTTFQVFAIIYLAGVALSVFLLLVRVGATVRLVLHCRPIEDPRLKDLCRELAGPKVQLCQSDGVQSPACLVLPSRMIVLPRNHASRLSTDHLKCVLRHEAVHLERSDWLICWLQHLLTTSMWFHPSAWRMSRLLSEDRELSCDAIVVRQNQNPKTYADAVLACCQPIPALHLPLTTGFDSPAGIKRRLEMLAFANQKTSRSRRVLTGLLALLCLTTVGAIHSAALLAAPPRPLGARPGETPQAQDTDQDGLSDFAEKHKYLTDPNNPDTDGDGTPDGDWNERREYQYTIRSVVQVIRPVTIEFLSDHYQDAQVLDETDQYVELEVFHYPFNTVASAIRGNDDWRQATSQMKKWLQPGPSADWTPEMQADLERQLLGDGIDVNQLNDRQIVEQASKWLCDRTESTDGFTSFITAWDEDGKPYVPEGLDGAIQRELEKTGRTLEEQWQREVSASGMFRHKTRGSCTSSSIYLAGCLKALGIPTRTVYCIPIIDASDDREFDLIGNLQQPGIRQHLLTSLSPIKRSWASHTFNEVYVGGQWHRLNYSRLGQGIYDRHLFGLVTHVGTFNDWADAKAHETIGRRQKSSSTRDVFGYRNPYSTISLRDEMGPHCQLEMPKLRSRQHVVESVSWTDDEALPQSIRDNCRRSGRFGLIAKVTGAGPMQELLAFLDQADVQVLLKPKNEKLPVVSTGFDRGCVWLDRGEAMIYLPLGSSDIHDLAKHESYLFQPQDQSAERGFRLSGEIAMVRTADLPGAAQDLRRFLPQR